MYKKLMVAMLPDAYNKSEGSNNAKLLQLFGDQFDEIAEMLSGIESVLDIDNATGVTLDMIGANIDQKRGSLNDNVYRILIKTKVAAIMGNCSINSIIGIVKNILGSADTVIGEGWAQGSPEQAMFTFSTDLTTIVEAGFTLGQFVQLLNMIKSVGVSLQTQLQGTFEFGEVAEYGPLYDDGLADVDQAVGGTLGYVYDSNGSIPLPV